MYTWLLWRALLSPPRQNPLYKQMQIISRPSWLDRFWNGFASLLLLLLFLKPPVFVLLILAIPIAYPILSSTCYGLVFSLRTSRMIFTRRQQGSYDLILISPHGAWQAFWGVCAGSVHHNGDLDRLNRYLRRIMTMLFAMGIFIFMASFVVPTDRVKSELVGGTIVLFTVISLMYLEFTQSSVLSTMIGMTFAIFARTTVDSRIGSLVGFLMLQLATYLTSLVLVMSFLYPLLDQSDLSPVIRMILGCATLLAYIFTVREMMIIALWHLLSRRLNTADDEMRQIVISSL